MVKFSRNGIKLSKPIFFQKNFKKKFLFFRGKNRKVLLNVTIPPSILTKEFDTQWSVVLLFTCIKPLGRFPAPYPGQTIMYTNSLALGQYNIV